MDAITINLLNNLRNKLKLLIVLLEIEVIECLALQQAQRLLDKYSRWISSSLKRHKKLLIQHC